MWWLTEHTAELAAEMGRRQSGGTGKVSDRERFEIPAIGEILRSQQMPGWRYFHHVSSLARMAAIRLRPAMLVDVMVMGARIVCVGER